MAGDVAAILAAIGMRELNANFEKERVIGAEMAICLQDVDLTRLGLTTIGDRLRFREEARKRSGLTSDPRPSQTNDTNSSSSSSQAFSLFRASRTRFVQKRKKVIGRPWTGTFVCLSQNDARFVPSSSQREVLQNAGLGCRKILMCSTDTEEDVRVKLMSEDGFPALKTGGGFEILKCSSNCRRLEVLKSAWDANNLRMMFGSQCKAYLRPIQHCLSLQPVVNVANPSAIMEECDLCKLKFLVSELREHVTSCSPKTSELLNSDSNEESLSSVTNNAQANAHHVQSFTINDNESEELPALDYNTNSSTLQVNELITVDGSVTTNGNDELYEDIIKYCTENNINEPIEILRIMQQRIVTGRALEIDNEAEAIDEGETNFIIVSRDNILEEGLEELRGITNPRLTLEVQFTGEAAVDLGGPRKEFFRLMLQNIQEKYFQPLRHWANDFEVIGKLFGLSLLQNGNLPRVMDSELVEELFLSENPRPFLKDMQKGLDSLGIFKIVRQLPVLLHLFTPGQNRKITFKMISHLLKPSFSETGTNRKVEENRIYRKYNKYLKEVANDIGYDYKVTTVIHSVIWRENIEVIQSQGRLLHNHSRELEINVPKQQGRYVVSLTAVNTQINLSSPVYTVDIDTSISGEQQNISRGSDSNPGKIIAIVFGIIGGLVIVLVLIFIVKYVRARQKSESMSLVNPRLPLDQFYMENPKDLYRSDSRMSIKRRSGHSFYSFQEDDSFHGSRSMLKDGGTPKKRGKKDNDVLLVSRNPLYHDTDVKTLSVINSRETTPEHQETTPEEESCIQSEITAPVSEVTEHQSHNSTDIGSDVTGTGSEVTEKDANSTKRTEEAITPLSAKDLEEDIMKLYSSMNDDSSGSTQVYQQEQPQEHIYSSIHSEGQRSRSQGSSSPATTHQPGSESTFILQKPNVTVPSSDCEHSVTNGETNGTREPYSQNEKSQSNRQCCESNKNKNRTEPNGARHSNLPKPPTKVLSLEGLRPNNAKVPKGQNKTKHVISEDSVPLFHHVNSEDSVPLFHHKPNKQISSENKVNNDENSSDTDSLFAGKGGKQVDRVRPLDIRIEDNLLSDEEFQRDLVTADLY